MVETETLTKGGSEEEVEEEDSTNDNLMLIERSYSLNFFFPFLRRATW